MKKLNRNLKILLALILAATILLLPFDALALSGAEGTATQKKSGVERYRSRRRR